MGFLILTAINKGINLCTWESVCTVGGSYFILWQVEGMSVLRPAEQRISWQEKKRILSNLYGRGGLVVVCETGVVVHEAPPNSNNWKIEDYGVPTIISNLNELVISIVDFDTAEPHREYSITVECDYRVQKSHFHTFICEDDDGSDLLVGLSFANSEVARHIAEAVDQLTPGKLFKFSEEKRKSLTKHDISQPSGFRHVAHISNDIPTQVDPISGLSALEQKTGNGVANIETSSQEIGSSPKKSEAIGPSPPQGKEIGKPSAPQETKVCKPTPPHGLYSQFKRLYSASPPKKSQKGGRRVIEISSPIEFKHVAHMGTDKSFAPKNEDGTEDPFQMSGDFTSEHKHSSSSSDQHLSGGEEPESKRSRAPMEISSPHDFQHIAHVSKDTAISVFLLTGKKDPFSIVTAITNSSSSPKPSSPPKSHTPPKIPVPPDPPSLPTLQPPEPRRVISPPKITYPPPPPKLDHSEFLKEISTFNPAYLRHVSMIQKEPPKDPNSLQEILKNSFEHMRGKLKTYWRDSIITTFTDHLDGDDDDEFDYPGVYLPEEVRNELEQ